jgi:pimeloyl-ACP methyl ester carboxylesterase
MQAMPFHCVIPSMPGYGISGKPPPRVGPRSHRTRLDVLMKRLGYTKFVAQGGDWGAIITGLMGAQAPRNCSHSHQHGRT